MHILDLRNSLLPLSLLKLISLFKRIDPVDCLEIRFADTGDKADVLRVLPASGYEIVLDDALSDPLGGFRLRVRKKG